MKRGQTKTKQELIDGGYSFIENFHRNEQIWGKENHRILWDYQTQKITFEYRKEVDDVLDSTRYFNLIL